MNTFPRTLSLVEYRILCPNTAEVPTLTQMGLIGVVLARTHQKAFRRARRRARFERLWKTLLSPSFWTHKAANSVLHSDASAFSSATGTHA